QRTLLRRVERDRSLPVGNLERPEDAEFHRVLLTAPLPDRQTEAAQDSTAATPGLDPPWGGARPRAITLTRRERQATRGDARRLELQRRSVDGRPRPRRRRAAAVHPDAPGGLRVRADARRVPMLGDGGRGDRGRPLHDRDRGAAREGGLA